MVFIRVVSDNVDGALIDTNDAYRRAWVTDVRFLGGTPADDAGA
jgi:hypothetical protein